MTRKYFRSLSQSLHSEHNGDLGGALVKSISLLQDTSGGKFNAVAEANADRLMLKIARLAAGHLKLPEALHEVETTPYTFHRDTAGLATAPALISLTTISTRLDACYQSIQSLKAQSTKTHSINLYISETPFLLDQGISRRDPMIAQIARLGVNIYIVPNIGPYRKQFPIISQLRSSGAPGTTCIVTTDDDVLYPDGAIERIVAHARTHNEITAHRGRRMIGDGERYENYSRFGVPTSTSSLENLPNGRNGVAFLLSHIPTEAKYLVGPVIAPTADDLWLKFVTLVKCIPCAVLEPQAIIDKAIDYPDVFPDRKEGLWRGFNAGGGNDLSVKTLDYYFSRLLDIKTASLIQAELK